MNIYIVTFHFSSWSNLAFDIIVPAINEEIAERQVRNIAFGYQLTYLGIGNVVIRSIKLSC